MASSAQRFGATLALLALVAAGVPPLPAQSTNQVSNTPQGGFVLKANSELVLTNVVARDAKTGELVKDLKQSDFKIYENGREQQISTFDFESVDMATPLKEATVSGLAAGPTGKQSRGRGQARGAAQPSADRHVLRPHFDAARRSRAQRGSGADYSSKPRCSPPISSRWFLLATRSPSTRTLPPTRMR